MRTHAYAVVVVVYILYFRGGNPKKWGFLRKKWAFLRKKCLFLRKKRAFMRNKKSGIYAALYFKVEYRM